MSTIGVGVQTPEKSEKKYKEVVQTKESAVINVSADELWNIIGPGFGEVYKWSRAVDHAEISGESQFEGAVCTDRYCDVNAKGFNKISEKLVEYSDKEQILAYNVYEGMPGFVHFAQNRWRIIEVGPNQSRIEMTITMRMKPFMGSLMGGMFRKNLNTTLDGALEDIQIYAETGKMSAAKRERMEKLEKMNS